MAALWAPPRLRYSGHRRPVAAIRQSPARRWRAATGQWPQAEHTSVRRKFAPDREIIWAVYGEAGWHDFFLMVGGGAAALTGLVFVAMSLHLDQIALNAAHRHRARPVLTGLTAVFIRCAPILMAGQGAQMGAPPADPGPGRGRPTL